MSGIKSLAHWWLRGLLPVRPSVAQSRAEVCFKCPMNQEAGLFEELSGAAAEVFKAALEQKHQLSLKLENEHKLGVCEPCGCDLPLKVFSPREAIFLKGQQPDYFDQLWAECWIKRL